MNAAALRAWFEKLAPRERVLVAVAAALAVFAILFSLSFRPLLSARAAAAATVEQQRDLLGDLEQVARRGPQGAAAGLEVRNEAQAEETIVVRAVGCHDHLIRDGGEPLDDSLNQGASQKGLERLILSHTGGGAAGLDANS